MRAQDEISILFVTAEPTQALIVLDDAVLHDELRAVHEMPAVERLPIEEADETFLVLVGGEGQVRRPPKTQRGKRNNKLGDTAFVNHGFHLFDSVLGEYPLHGAASFYRVPCHNPVSRPPTLLHMLLAVFRGRCSSSVGMVVRRDNPGVPPAWAKSALDFLITRGSRIPGPKRVPSWRIARDLHHREMTAKRGRRWLHQSILSIVRRLLRTE